MEKQLLFATNYMEFTRMSHSSKKVRKLFIKGDNPSEYAYIGWGDMETRFYGYMIGYKDAADLIIAHALAEGDNATLDSMIYPACFLYRQYLELALKDIYLSNAKDTIEKKNETIKSCQHDLSKIWKKVKSLIIANFSKGNKEELEEMGNYIIEFNNMDTMSFSFRYPIDKKMNLVHDNVEFIDLRNFTEVMDELSNFLSGVRDGMADHRDNECQWFSAVANFPYI